MEALGHGSTIVFSPEGRTITFENAHKLTMALTPNGLGWLGVRAITNPKRIARLLQMHKNGQIVASIQKSPLGVGLPRPAKWTGLELLRLMHVVFGHASLTSLLATIKAADNFPSHVITKDVIEQYIREPCGI